MLDIGYPVSNMEIPYETTMTSKKTAHQIIQEMPKVELHLHLEGAFTFEFLFSLIEKYGGDPDIKSEDDLRRKFVFRDFQHFVDLWFWKNRYFRVPEDFEQCAYSTIKNLASQNVIYGEVFFSPWDFSSNVLKVEEIAEATLHGIKRAESDFTIQCNLIADIVRDYGSETATERVEQILPFMEKGLIGIGLGGSEQKFPARYFKDAFHNARKNGLHLTAHAGEASGPESLWEAIRDLKVERIGHGVRAIEDPELISYLKDTQIPLEVCVNSNLKTKIYPSINMHPVQRFIEKQLNVTINSDDPTMFGATLTEEFAMLYDGLGITNKELRQLTTNGINSAFISNREKAKLKEKVQLFWDEQSD